MFCDTYSTCCLQALWKTLQLDVCSSSKFNVLLGNPHHLYTLTSTCCTFRSKPSNECIPSHTNAHNVNTTLLSCGNGDETQWQCQAQELGSEFYWSAICGTNSFATNPSRVMDSQIPGVCWHPVATDSMRHFNCSKKCTPIANIVYMPELKKKERLYCAHTW